MILVPEFILKDLDNEYVRENFKRLNLFFQNESILKGSFKFFSLSFNGAVTNELIQHGLGFKPLDVIQTSVTGPGAITFNFSAFTKDAVSVTTTGACAVRAFIGAYKENV